MFRSVSIDDSPMPPRGATSSKKVFCAAVFSRGPQVEGIEFFSVTRDGLDSTRKILQALSGSKFFQGTKLVLVNSVTLAGLNLIDLPRLSTTLSLPVVAVTENAPDTKKMRSAILKTKLFSKRIELLSKAGKAEAILVKEKKYFIQFSGCSEKQAKQLVGEAGLEGLRLAHFAAGALSKIRN